jgi:hypothetical protein
VTAARTRWIVLATDADGEQRAAGPFSSKYRAEWWQRVLSPRLVSVAVVELIGVRDVRFLASTGGLPLPGVTPRRGAEAGSS